jgi:hypothetical protein
VAAEGRTASTKAAWFAPVVTKPPYLRGFVTLVVLAAVVGAAPAGAAKTPRVLTQVVGQSELVAGWRITTPSAFSMRLGGRTCRVPAGTPLAALEQVRRQTGPEYAVTGTCAKPSVRSIGDEKGTGRSPWVYKIGRELGSDPAGQRLKANDEVLWFRCARTSRGCRRTLEITPAASRSKVGERITVTVRGYDDKGRGVPVKGATVTLNNLATTTDAKGRATLVAPGPKGPYPLFATAPGMADAFPARVTST